MFYKRRVSNPLLSRVPLDTFKADRGFTLFMNRQIEHQDSPCQLCARLEEENALSMLTIDETWEWLIQKAQEEERELPTPL